MFCKYCGSKIADDAIFCEKCGKKLVETDSTEESKQKEAENTNINSEQTTEKADNITLTKTKKKFSPKLMKNILIASILICALQGIITAKSFADLSKYQQIAAGMRYTPSASWQQEQLYGVSPSDRAKKQIVATAWDNVYFAQIAVKRNCILLVIFLAFTVAIIISYNRTKKNS